MELSGLIPSSRRPGQYRLSVDGQFFGYIRADDVLGLHLKVGQHLSEEEVEQLRVAVIATQAQQLAVNYSLRRRRSSGEVALFLRRRQVPEAEIKPLIKRLVSQGLVDDQAFAQSYAHDVSLGRPLSKSGLKQKLKAKQLSSELIDQALAEYDEDAALKRAIEKKQAHYQSDPNKLINYLIRQGFSYESIKRQLRRDS